MPLTGNDYFLWNALGGGSGVSSGGAGGQSPTGSQFAAASRSAGLTGGLGGAGFNPSIQQNKQLDLQTQLLSNQLSTRKRLTDLLLGQFGSGGAGGGAYGGQGSFVQSLLDQMQNAGAGQTAAINQQFNTLANNAQANFAQRGLGGSSGVPSVMSGIERQRALALAQLNDQLLMNRIGVQERAADRALQMQSLLSQLLT